MDQNPYKAPEAGNEPAMRQPAQPRTIGATAKSCALIGGIIMFCLSAIPLAAYFVVVVVNSIRINPYDHRTALVLVLASTLAGSAVGAALGALFQAIVNAVIRLTSKKTPPSD